MVPVLVLFFLLSVLRDFYLYTRCAQRKEVQSVVVVLIEHCLFPPVLPKCFLHMYLLFLHVSLTQAFFLWLSPCQMTCSSSTISFLPLPSVLPTLGNIPSSPPTVPLFGQLVIPSLQASQLQLLARRWKSLLTSQPKYVTHLH